MAMRPPRRMRRIFALEDMEPAARRFLPRPLFGYVSGAAETGLSYRDNRAVFDEIALLPRALVDVSERRLDTMLMGQSHAMPVGIAPMGISALTAYRGDIVLARSAAKAGIPMILSGSSLISIEEVLAAAPGTWFQAYLPQEAERIAALLARAARAGVETLVITVDTPVIGSRENNLRTGFKTPLRPDLHLLWDGVTHPAWATGVFLRTFLHGMPHFENSFAERGAPLLSKQASRDHSGRAAQTWEVIRRIRSIWKGRLVLKGLLHPADVGLARAHGADGVILSNHGGRQLDGAPSPMRVLPRAVETAAGMPVMIDSGFRRGTDVLKALSMGAAFCFVGRPFNYAASLGGELGVAYAIALLREQVSIGMGLLGVARISDLNTGNIVRPI